jgi:hypothetical protein
MPYTYPSMKLLNSTATPFYLVLLLSGIGGLMFMGRAVPPPVQTPAAEEKAPPSSAPAAAAEPRNAGEKSEARPEASTQAAAPQKLGFFGGWIRRFKVLFGAEGAGMSFFQRLGYFVRGAGVAGSESSASSALSPGGATAAGAPGGPQDDVQRQIKAQMDQTLEQQKLMRELQALQRQSLENLRMTTQSQQHTRRAVEDAKTVRSSAGRR